MTKLDPTTWDFAKQLETTTGIAFTGQLSRALDRAVRRTLTHNGTTHRRELFSQLQTSPHRTVDLVDALAIGETYFFRHSRQFDIINSQLLVALAAREERPLTFWSAGCSTGEEAYSLAMLLDQANMLDGARVFATDINRHSLTKAQAGIYRRNSFRQDGGARVDGYVVDVGDGMQVLDRIRARVTFSQLNLVRDPFPIPPSDPVGLHLIMCRNVLMYFDDAVVKTIVSRFVASLAPGGYLVTGPTDPPLWSLPELEVVTLDAGAIYRKVAPCQPQPSGRARIRPATPPRRRSRTGTSERRRTRDASAPIARREAPQPEPEPPDHDLDAAEATLAAGEWERAAEMTRAMSSPEQASLHMRAMHGLSRERALHASEVAVERFPLHGEIHYHRATLEVCLGRYSEAIASLKRAVYNDRTLAIAHYLLALLLGQQGNGREATRAASRCRALCATMAPETLVPLGDGLTAEQLAEAAEVVEINAEAARGGS